MPKKISSTFSFLFLALLTSAQHPLHHWTEAVEIRYSMKQPVVAYSLTVDLSDYSSFSVEMRIRNISDTFEVAMAAHPEYDDRYWRYVENFSVETKNGKGKFIREDSALWKIFTTGKEAVLHYRIHLPLVDGMRSAWKAYLTPTGGLIGGPHSFMYIIGATLIPSYVTLKIPADWQIVTGLQSTVDPRTFFASSVFNLVDDPIFVGKFKSWSFLVDNTPHRLIYWSPSTIDDFNFDTLLLSVRKVIEQASLLFGRLPYRDYCFILEDSALGALEHNNSVTAGAPLSQLKQDARGALLEITHEYFHTWNAMRIRPVEYTDVDYKKPSLSKGLWFGEGVTIFYSDLLLRRAGIPVFDSSRLDHLQVLIRRYLANPAYQKYDAEKISMASYGPPDFLGDYQASTHLQGEVLGSMLDIIIRDATNGRNSFDDVMREMMKNFSGEKGFTSKDIEQTVTKVCNCNVHTFFNDHVFGTKQIDFNKYLQFIGLKYSLEWKDFVSNDGKPIPDLRIFAFQRPNEQEIKIGLTTPVSCWGKAGLHTGDIIKSLNGKTIRSVAEFRNQIRNVKPGDLVPIEILRPRGLIKINVAVSGYQQPVVHISQISVLTEKQKRLFEQWSSANYFRR